MLKTIPPTTNCCNCGYFKSKCAEIHYQTSSFSILCIFCGLNTLDLNDFIDHFHKIHFEDFLKSIKSTNEPIVSNITEQTINSKTTCNDPLHIADQEIVDDPEEQMKKLKLDCDKLDDTNQAKNLCFESGNVKHHLVDKVNFHELKDHKEDSKASDDKRIFIKASNSIRKERNIPLICSHCGRKFKRSYQLAYHMNIHTGAKPFQCEVCGRQFKAKPTLTRHLTTHEQRSAYACEFCNKSFTHKAAFLSHKLRHTQTRTFKCDQCVKSFYTCNQVETHKRKMHAVDDSDLPFVCDMCGKHYRTASMLSTHRHKKHFAHAPFACEKCEKKFIDEKQLQIHKTIHTDTYTLSLE